MANISFALGVSHGPLLSTPADKWGLRADDDRKNPAHPFREKTYTFDQLAELRKGENLEDQIRLEVCEERHARCQTQIAALADKIAEVDPDVMVIIGDDQHEWFQEDLMPSFTVYYGDTVVNRAMDKEKEKTMSPGLLISRWANKPPEDQTYPCQSDLALDIIDQAIDDGFDVTSAKTMPVGPSGPIGIGHAFGFIYRRILNDKPIPCVPILINTFFPPNQPNPKRCLEFGKSIGQAIRAWGEDKKVALIASGGLSHFVVDEEFDRTLLDAMQAGDEAGLTAHSNAAFQSGTSEIKNWIITCGALAETKLEMDILDYVPCYRSEAGTGSGMGFATWT